MPSHEPATESDIILLIVASGCLAVVVIITGMLVEHKIKRHIDQRIEQKVNQCQP